MVEFLTSKFDGKFTTSYSIKELDSKELDVSRSKEKLMSFRNVKGSSNFQVVVFTPNEQMRASMRLCVCIKCRDIYGSCGLFQPYKLFFSTLNKVSLRSDSENMIEENEDVEIDENDEDFLICDTYCAVAAGIYSSDTFWFFKINDISVASDF